MAAQSLVNVQYCRRLGKMLEFVLYLALCSLLQLLSCRYDVELFQRIEHLISKKLPLYPTEEEEVMQMMERVTEAQRYAKMVCLNNVS